MPAILPVKEKYLDIEAIERLPRGSKLLIEDVSWDEYEEYLVALGGSSYIRTFYDNGLMELIMSPAKRHERAKTVVHDLMMGLAFECEILLTCFASTTLKLEAALKGAEPDDSFYVKHAARAIANQDENLDLQTEPPPDLVIEIDRMHSSLNKFQIYSSLGVPEFWRIRGRQVKFYLLRDGAYHESGDSGAFPFLSTNTLSQFLDQGLREGEMAAVLAFRKWLREQRQVLQFKNPTERTDQETENNDSSDRSS